MILDITGRRFTRLYVVGLYEVRNKRAYWNCLCDCGNTLISRSDALKEGHTKSCGCWNTDRIRTHGRSTTPEFKTWQSILQRCENSKDANYPNYGGRGICVCERWQKFQNFFIDMGPRPSNQHSIDRKDNDGNYEPDNCRWATRFEQMNNRSITLHLTFLNQTKPLGEWARQYGLKSNIVWNRIFICNWTVDQALTTPVGGAPSYS